MTAARFAKLAGIGASLPSRIVGNDHFERYLATSDEWIVARSGIRHRRLAEPDSKLCDLAEPAARQALDRASCKPDQVDLIIVATTTPDRIFPATACLLQAQLGITNCPAFDLQAVCSGFVYALVTADAFIRTGLANCALVVGADIFSRIIDWEDRSTCILFGDGAGAAILTAATKPGISAVDLGADGSFADLLTVPGYVAGARIVGKGTATMDGRPIFKLAIKSMVKACTAVCARAKIEPANIDWFVPHQANERIIRGTAAQLGIPEKAVVSVVAEQANTSAASVPLALDSLWPQLRVGQNILLAAAGGGLTWGAALITI